ncbi:MAG: ABC transporter ATP-binding protein [Flavisolibacter sp.]|nr:ABC transporter ATP-binding protein [Flavisolibacter sp.]
MSLLEVSGISRQEEDIYVLKDISFTQHEFQNTAIAGATGSGKTTLLKIIAGLVQPHAGEVLFEGTRVKGPDEKLIPGHPRIAYLSQHFELLHHYRVEEIIQMANQLSDEEADIICEVCRISHLLKRWTHQLSGGEKQRIALARLLVSSPGLLLLDEPYSNLDALHKSSLKSVLHDLGEELKITCLLVSHDPIDVLSWADEVQVLQEGQIVQKGSPEEVYHTPVNDYTASLFGKYNVLSSSLCQAFAEFTGKNVRQKNPYVRPEHFGIVADESKGLAGEVEQVHFMGNCYEIAVNISGDKIIVQNNKGSFKNGDIVYVSFA